MKEKNKILLLSCCLPCSCGAIKQLKEKQIPNDDFAVMFFNPNIYPEVEYNKRLNELIKYCEKLNVKYIVGNYNHKKWLEFIKGFENEKERGKRCSLCFQFRFMYAKKWALENNYSKITSVFGISRHKNQNQVNEAGLKILGKDVYTYFDFDTKLQSNILKTSNFYKQKYCGCEFSIIKTIV